MCEERSQRVFLHYSMNFHFLHPISLPLSHTHTNTWTLTPALDLMIMIIIIHQSITSRPSSPLCAFRSLRTVPQRRNTWHFSPSFSAYVRLCVFVCVREMGSTHFLLLTHPYTLWSHHQVTYVAVVANSIATCVTMIAMFSYGTRSDAIFLPMFLASFIHILLGTFGIFIFQFLPVYYAVCIWTIHSFSHTHMSPLTPCTCSQLMPQCRGSNSLRYICAFITQALWVVYFLLMAIGIPHLGSSGLLTGLLHIPWVKQQWWLLIFNVLFGLVWAAFAIFSIVVLVLLVVHYRRDNSSVFEAKTQLFGMVARRRLTSSI